MINLVIGLLLAALVSAFFGFGGMATNFADTARILFFVFLALLAISSIFTFFGARTPGVGKAARTLALVATVAVVSIGAYAWIQNDMSAERLGRVVDRQTVAIVDTTGEALSDAGDRTQSFVADAVDEIRTDTKQAADDVTDDDHKQDRQSKSDR